jgi:hypothetical protein
MLCTNLLQLITKRKPTEEENFEDQENDREIN